MVLFLVYHTEYHVWILVVIAAEGLLRILNLSQGWCRKRHLFPRSSGVYKRKKLMQFFHATTLVCSVYTCLYTLYIYTHIYLFSYLSYIYVCVILL